MKPNPKFNYNGWEVVGKKGKDKEIDSVPLCGFKTPTKDITSSSQKEEIKRCRVLVTPLITPEKATCRHNGYASRSSKKRLSRRKRAIRTELNESLLDMNDANGTNENNGLDSEDDSLFSSPTTPKPFMPGTSENAILIAEHAPAGIIPNVFPIMSNENSALAQSPTSNGHIRVSVPKPIIDCSNPIEKKNSSKFVYAVALGKKIGVFEHPWNDIKVLVLKHVGARFKKFKDKGEAWQFILNHNKDVKLPTNFNQVTELTKEEIDSYRAEIEGAVGLKHKKVNDSHQNKKTCTNITKEAVINDRICTKNVEAVGKDFCTDTIAIVCNNTTDESDNNTANERVSSSDEKTADINCRINAEVRNMIYVDRLGELETKLAACMEENRALKFVLRNMDQHLDDLGLKYNELFEQFAPQMVVSPREKTTVASLPTIVSCKSESTYKQFSPQMVVSPREKTRVESLLQETIVGNEATTHNRVLQVTTKSNSNSLRYNQYANTNLHQVKAAHDTTPFSQQDSNTTSATIDSDSQECETIPKKLANLFDLKRKQYKKVPSMGPWRKCKGLKPNNNTPFFKVDYIKYFMGI